MHMTLVRWAPDAGAVTLADEVERLMAGLLPHTPGLPPLETRLAPIDMRREGDTLRIEASVPGFTRDEIKVSAEHGRLVIEAQKDQQVERKDEGFIRRERFVGRLYREVMLPEGADTEHIEADVEDGVLEVTVPMAKNTQPKRIPVSGSRKKRQEATTHGNGSSASEHSEARGRKAEPATAGAR
jgi:HSP20 family protein